MIYEHSGRFSTAFFFSVFGSSGEKNGRKQMEANTHSDLCLHWKFYPMLLGYKRQGLALVHAVLSGLFAYQFSFVVLRNE